jgi:hypothetical protein
MHTVIWKDDRHAREVRPCFHHKGDGRTRKQSPAVVRRIWRGVHVPVVEIGVAVRQCCVRDDPVVRVAWWDAVLDGLPGLLEAYPEVDGGWLMRELEVDVPWPNEEDVVVAHLLGEVDVPGPTDQRRETEYLGLLRAARNDARRLLAGGELSVRGTVLARAISTAGFRQAYGAPMLREVEEVLGLPFSRKPRRGARLQATANRSSGT